MIQIVMKPVAGAGMVNRENLYTAVFNGVDIGLRVRGYKAAHAEDKLMEVFKKNIGDKKGPDGYVVVDYNLEAWLKKKEENECQTETGSKETIESQGAQALLPGLS